MDWKNSRALKWAIFFALFFFGVFCFMKDKGYCEDYYESQVTIEEEVNFMDDGLPIEYEFLFQEGKCESFLHPHVAKYVNPYTHVWKDDPRKKQPSAAQRAEWQEAYDNHHFHGVRTYTDAYNKVWWLPNLTWRQLGRDAWVAACSMASTKTPGAALVVAFSTMLSQYGLHCLDEWDYIQDKLYWANYHFEQCIYYAKLLA